MRLIRKPARPAKPIYSAGDILTLKSGGRPMTVTWSGPVLFAPGNWLICQWFSDAGDLQQEMFPEVTLERAHDALAA
ncbi:YodC family protein [Paraburkholderia sp. BCC1886]|uniref:YodC family protein n=1 Tax=Paraburkholderia sp. BCC1886 TaxID=2562670 RepID=UPI0011824C6B|nr:YodC family protein [Paraburkholderia sp. BCC1886]